MAYLKREESQTELTARIRLNAVKNIDSTQNSSVNFGSTGKSLTATDYEEQLNVCKNITNELNTSLEVADAKVNALKAARKKLSNMNTEILSGIRSKYGVDSTEYEQAGGTRQSERKRPHRKSKQIQ